MTDLNRVAKESKVLSEKRWFRIPEAARYAGTAIWFIRSLLWAGKVPYLRCGKRFIIDKNDLDRFLESEKQGAAIA